jgi:NAD(P)-dependent dehydrogenase (short-subunit alcohol dehydrogenase family)
MSNAAKRILVTEGASGIGRAGLEHSRDQGAQLCAGVLRARETTTSHVSCLTSPAPGPSR